MEKSQLKMELYNACIGFVKNKQTTIETTVKSNQEALNSESKSSAGDKHETGRAMLQLEMEKAGQQLQELDKMRLMVEKIDVSKLSKTIALGSVIKTTTSNYFLGISMGKVEVENQFFYIVSPSSPIGRTLLGKVKNEVIVFQGVQSKILEVF